MRILLVTPYYAPAWAFGGPVRVLATLARGLVEAGHEVTVATTDALDTHHRVPPDAAPEPPGVRVVRFPNVNHALAARAMGWSPRGYRAWVRAHAGEFDVIHLNDIYSVLSVAAARAAVAAGVPYVVQPHGSAATTRERGRVGVKRAFLALWGRRTLAEASATLAATARERADLVGSGARPERVADVPPPVELPHAGDRPGLPERPTVVFLGRLDPIKQVDVLLQAAARAPSRPRVVIVGSGPEERRLRAQAAALDVEVEWAGFLDGSDKVRALQAAHALVLLSRSEGLPVAALEAMACGTPVVLSTGCNLPEVDGVAGAVVPDRAAAAADAIERVLAGRARLADGAAAFAERYRAERVLEELIALYARLRA